MSILILGGQGNLGSQLTDIFSDTYNTFSWDREDLDVLDFDKLKESILELKPELIINTIAYNAVDSCEDENGFELAKKLNVKLPRILAELSIELDAVLMQYSSDYVFSGTKEKQFFLEHETPNPINKYGETKFWGEDELIKREKFGLKYYLIRTSKLFGPAGKSEGAKPSFFDIMIKKFNDNNDQLLTVVNEELSCFTYTPDLAQASKRLWELKVPFGVFHLVNENPITWYEAACNLFSLLKVKANIRPVRSEDLPRPARRPKFSILKNTKVKKLRPYEEALAEYLDIKQ